MKVLKRNNKLEDFDISKILDAVRKAYKACNKEVSVVIEEELQHITDYLIGDTISVDKIHDRVIRILMDLAPYDVTISYILYRERHKQARFIRERLDYMERYATSSDNAATSSETDANANVTMKNVANLEGEVYKTTNRTIQRQRMKDKLNELYPEVAKQYEEDLNNHIIYTHDEASTPVLKNYCEAVSLYPLITEGVGNIDGVTPKPPANLDSFCGQFVNLAFLLASQCKGAVAFGGFFVAFNYYCVKEWGEFYYEKDDIIVDTEHCLHKKTIGDKIIQAFQQCVWGINQPAGNRGYQSPFINFSYYDSNYFKALFEAFCYPDGTKPKWEAIDYLQRKFMKYLNKERLNAVIAMPVETMALLSDGNDIIDKEYKKFTAEMYAEGHSFFTYISDNPNGLASCCFTPETKILWKSSTEGVQLTTLKELNELKWDPDKKNLKIFHNGFWIKGRSIKTSNTNFYRVKTANHKVYYMTDNHINVTFDGEKKTKDLKVGDYLMFNTCSLQAVPENDENLTYEQGFAVGAFLGDGSFGSRFKDGIIYDINYSQNANKYKACMNNVTKAAHQLGSSNVCSLNKVYNNVYPVRISSKELVAFIQRWTNWTEGTCSYNKELNLDCLLQSYEFRKGILDGWYNTDGGNSNRCYTTSEKLKDCMEVLITSLGINSIIDYSDRTDEKVIIREQEYNRNYPLWCIRWYSQCNKSSMKDVYKWKNNSQFFKIIEITHLGESPEERYSYCIECTDKNNPYFTLPSGLITHNCRLRNEIEENTFSFTNGLTGIQTGSVNVITLNINRIVQNFWKEYAPDGMPNFVDYGPKEDFKRYLITILERVYKYHIAYKTMLYDMEDKGMLTSSKAGYIYMKKLYCTIGLNGINEAAEFLGMECSYNKDYMEFCNLITSTIKEQNKLHNIRDKKRPFLFNTEFVPAESLGVKNYNWDKEDGYEVNPDRNLYNSYFYLAHDDTSVLDKFRLHGKNFTSTLDGGVGCHINLEEHLSKEQYIKLIEFAVKEGTSYFTFNIPNSECEECGYITKHPINKCPKCGSTKITWYTRIIGYLRAIKNFGKERQIEAEKRVYSKNVKI